MFARLRRRRQIQRIYEVVYAARLWEQQNAADWQRWRDYHTQRCANITWPTV